MPRNDGRLWARVVAYSQQLRLRNDNDLWARVVAYSQQLRLRNDSDLETMTLHNKLLQTHGPSTTIFASSPNNFCFAPTIFFASSLQYFFTSQYFLLLYIRLVCFSRLF